MNPVSIAMLTICGLEDLQAHSCRGITHVLSILDPGWPDPEAFLTYNPHRRAILHFHDAIEPAPNVRLPEIGHVEAILDFGRSLAEDAAERGDRHLLVRCHMGVSRSTAAMAILLAQARPEENEDSVFGRLLEVRPQAWPNSRIIGFADGLLGRGGRLTSALARLYGRQLFKSPQLVDVMHRIGRGREVDMARGGS
ncbi:tyrosine phosphatase family protein [Microvirga massiliensis]|uniref:tyrosine phosphatase family protein n=1 Tax=Microvirga massiliensis TaxID=1033741 RepID=UPI00062B86AA|nr:protein-tyrosine-phosphatase [Microvirga massiliensis]